MSDAKCGWKGKWRKFTLSCWWWNSVSVSIVFMDICLVSLPQDLTKHIYMFATTIVSKRSKCVLPYLWKWNYKRTKCYFIACCQRNQKKVYVRYVVSLMMALTSLLAALYILWQWIWWLYYAYCVYILFIHSKYKCTRQPAYVPYVCCAYALQLENGGGDAWKHHVSFSNVVSSKESRLKKIR